MSLETRLKMFAIVLGLRVEAPKKADLIIDNVASRLLSDIWCSLLILNPAPITHLIALMCGRLFKEDAKDLGSR